MNFDCKFCKQSFCVNCVQYEIHECSNIHEMKQHQVNDLRDKLHKEKTFDVKITKI